MELINESNLGAADAGALRIGERRRGDLIHVYVAAVGMLEEARNMQERRLACSGRRHQSDRLPGPNRKLGAFENFKGDVALPIMPIHCMQIQDRRLLSAAGGSTFCGPARALSIADGAIHSGAPRPDRGAQRARTGRAWPAEKGPAP